MMNAAQLRQSFLDFFATKQHRIVPSAPMVVKNDPTLMFTNAGMNQFKEIFLGNTLAVEKRVANSQKCLRVSGKHNDLEEVGHDTYHHTMFEMLGNWSFGDYFKNEAIDWAWEYLVEVLKLDATLLYATVFEGDKQDGLDRDTESFNYWTKHLPESHVLNGNKKDNFWEMGDAGPCGPCSEVHIDLRSEEDKKKIPGRDLVNAGHPEVIEIWNLVFIQYNRKASGQLELLPAKHVDTGMGFERLCRALQGKASNYDTDIFTPLLDKQCELTNLKYGVSEQTDIAMRVVADHVRTIAFAIADGQLPSNVKAGYVIRRILRRAVRYGYTFLGRRESFLSLLIEPLIETMGQAYPELVAQKGFIIKVIHEEEESFLRTLETGISLLDKIIADIKASNKKVITGKQVFELYDTFGFPIDLTDLIAHENQLEIDKSGFEVEMEAQKQRARNATSVQTDDWVIVTPDEVEEFVGYDYQTVDVVITRYRKVKQNNKELFQVVFNVTPFYAESGGQIGDKGRIVNASEVVEVLDTKKENNLIVHLMASLPKDPFAKFTAEVNKQLRQQTAGHHSVTHLLHKALREVLGSHVEQKGSLVSPEHLRFDFAHFQKVSDEELKKVEALVNLLIRENSILVEHRTVPMSIAQELGAVALFGEMYGEVVRIIQFGGSIELCGGTHVGSTGEIGLFKIVSESSIATGIRRIEGVAGGKAEAYVEAQFELISELKGLMKNPPNLRKSIELLIEESSSLAKKVESMQRNMIAVEIKELIANAQEVNGVSVVSTQLSPALSDLMKDFAMQLRSQFKKGVAVLGTQVNGNPKIAVALSDELVEIGLNAVEIIREASKEIQGGGGGKPFFAEAGGKNIAGLEKAMNKALELIKAKL